MKKILSVLLTLTVSATLLAGCRPTDGTPSDNGNGSTAPATADFSKTDADMFTERDAETAYDAGLAVTVTLNGTTATADSDSVRIAGSTVTLTEEATYVVSGELTDGRLVVNAPDTAKLHLVFDGVTIRSGTSAALYILAADKVFLTLADGSENTLANGGSFTAVDDNNIDAALFSKQDLTINGTGSLTVTSPAGHGITCKDDLVMFGGTYVIHAASHGLDANDSVRLGTATLTIDAGKDAIHAENNDDAARGFVYLSGTTVTAEAEGDGIAAGAYLQIVDGTVDLLVGGGAENGTNASSGNYGDFMGGGPGGKRPGGNQNTVTATDAVSMKGLKAATGLLIADGRFTINAADDAVHSDASVILNGGSFSLASGDDAVHAEDTLTVTAGTLEISECYEGLEALHIDIQGGNIKLNATDDGLNAAGGTDQSGTEGGRDGMFGGMGGRPGGMGGGMSANSNGSIVIAGGTLYIRSSGDGIDANGTLTISGGHTTVVGPTRGDTATLDYDKTAVITGGTFIGTGSTMMAQTFSDSEQGVIAVNAGNQTAGTAIELKDSSGTLLLSCRPELDFAVIILSSPELKKGDEYTLSVGSESGVFEAA